MVKTLAGLRRALQPGAVIELAYRERPTPPGGIDATGVPRRVVKSQGNAVALESVRTGSDAPSWLYWPKASEVTFSIEAGTCASLFTIRGVTYRIVQDSRVGAAGGGR